MALQEMLIALGARVALERRHRCSQGHRPRSKAPNSAMSGHSARPAAQAVAPTASGPHDRSEEAPAGVGVDRFEKCENLMLNQCGLADLSPPSRDR
jgi:hypothetical protein